MIVVGGLHVFEGLVDFGEDLLMGAGQIDGLLDADAAFGEQVLSACSGFILRAKMATFPLILRYANGLRSGTTFPFARLA